MSEVLNAYLLDDIREWIAINKDNRVQISSNDHVYKIYDHTDVILPNINILDNHSNILFCTTRCVWHLCKITILYHNIDYIHFLPTRCAEHNLKIRINANGSITIRTLEHSLKDGTIQNCYTMKSLYSYIQNEYLSDANIKDNSWLIPNIKDDSWSIPNFFENIPKFKSFQYLLDQFNQPILEDTVIEI